MNKKIVLDFEANFDKFKSSMRSSMDEVTKYNDKFLNQTTSSGSGSDSSRISAERERLNRVKQQQEVEREKFYSKYSTQDEYKYRGKALTNPFEKKAQQEFKAGEAKFRESDAAIKKQEDALNKNSETIKQENVDASIRHREYRSLSDKELKASAEELRLKSKEALEGGDVDKAEAMQKEMQSVQAAKKWRDSINGKEGGEESQQMKFMRQTARNMFMSEVLGSGSQILGHGTHLIPQLAQTGYQGFSAAQASGIGMAGSIASGGAIAAITGLVKLFSGGEDLLKAQNKVGGVVDKSKFGDFTGMESVGIGGPADQEMMMERAKNLARETGYGKNLANRTKQQYLLERGMGLSGGDTKAFTEFEGTKGNNLGAGEGTLMFTKMLEKLNTGITLGDNSGAGKDLARLPKYLEKLLLINERTFSVTGELSRSVSKQNMAFLGGAIGLGGIFKNEQNASKLIQGVQQSFQNPGDELLKFHNIRAIREKHPEMTPQQVIEMTENMNESGIFNARYQNLKKTHGGRIPNKGTAEWSTFVSEFQTQNQMGSSTEARKAIEAIEANKGMASGSMIKGFMGKGEGASKAEGNLTSMANGLTTEVEKMGSKIGNVIADLSKSVRSLVSTIDNFTGNKTPKTEEEINSNELKYGPDGIEGTDDDL